MSETCTVEVGLLKKHPCGATAVTRCVNCEQPLCSKHAVSRMSAGKKVFLCQECARAWKESEKLGDIPPAPSAAPAAPAPAARKPPEAPKPAPAARPAAAAKPAPAEKKPEPAIENSGPLEFTPGKPSAPQPQPKPEPAPAPKPPAPAPASGKTELSIEHSAPPEEKKK